MSVKEYDIWYRHTKQALPTTALFNYEVKCSLQSKYEIKEELAGYEEAFITHMIFKGESPNFTKLAPYLRELCIRKVVLSKLTLNR